MQIAKNHWIPSAPLRARPLRDRLRAAALLFTALLLVRAAPTLRAGALYLITDGAVTAAIGETEPLSGEKLLITGAETGENGVMLSSGRAVSVTHDGKTLLTTTRAGESVEGLLARLKVEVGPLEMVHVDLSNERVRITVGTDFTYYETAVETAAHTTLLTPDYTMPKGTTEVVRPGADGTREVTYEVVWADGALLSRQAVAERGSTAVQEVARIGTLVTEAQPGDAIASVVTEADGSGYLLLVSGDSLHFTGSMAVTCTAYTTGHDGVGTITASGTTVHVGSVAVDKSVIPLGTRLFVDTAAAGYTYGMSVAEDTGVRGTKLDLFMETYDECIRFGVRQGTVYFLDA